MEKLHSQIVELETKLAFLEQANQELSDAVYNQHQRFEQRLNAIERRFERLEQDDQQQSDPLDEKPPHY